MDQVIKQQWVAALRSGEYKQGKFVLQNNDHAFCCLGVLCDIIAPNEWRNIDNKNVHIDSVINLPDRISRQINLDEGTAAGLAQMNDSGASFAQIADHIESAL